MLSYIDMEDDITKKVQERYAELPPDIRQAVEAADLDTRVQTIGAKHRLHLDQMGVLQDEVLLVMLGFETPEKFVDAVVRATNISREEAAAIATDINTEVIDPIRESLKKFTASKATPTPAVPAAPAAPAPVTPAPKPQVPMAPHPHDLMLVEKTVTTPPAPKTPTPPPPKPQDYKADPYREPIGP